MSYLALVSVLTTPTLNRSMRTLNRKKSWFPFAWTWRLKGRNYETASRGIKMVIFLTFIIQHLPRLL
jgi:hypothetical protein